MALKGLIKFFLLAAVVSLAYGSRRQCIPRALPDDCKQKLRDINVIPKYADRVVTTDIEIVYNGIYKVKCGNSIPLSAVFNKPKITYKGAVPLNCDNMALILFDNDRATVNPYLQWMVVNIKPVDLFNGNLGKANEPFKYENPTQSGNNYVYFLYCYEGIIDPSKLTKYSRLNFNIRRFASENYLGNPQAANYHSISLLSKRRNN